MSPTRRDTLKAAGAASGLAMLGGHSLAQRGTPGDGGENPGAQQLEEGEAGVRVGHFVAGAPAVNVRLVPEAGTDTGGVGGGGNETNATDGNATDGNTTDGNTSEDLQFGDDESDNESDDGLFEDDTNETNETNGSDGTNGTNETNGTDDGTTDGTTGEGQLIAEGLSFGDVSEYANVEAGEYTLQLVEPAEGTTGTDGGNATDDNTTGTVGNDTTGGNETTDGNDTGGSDGSIISLPPELTEDDNDTNTSEENTSEDLQFGDDESDNETNDTNGTDDTDVTNGTNGTDGGSGGDDATDDGTTGATGGEVIHEASVTVGETYYTVAAVGESVADVQAVVLQDYDAAQVRLVHASPDAPVVDVVVPDATMTLFDGVGAGQGTEYVGVPPGEYSLSVREEAQMNDGEEVATADVEFDTGEAYTVYAVGSTEGGGEEFQLVVQQDGQGADAGLGSEGAPGQQPDGPGGNDTDVDGTDENATGGPPGQDDAANRSGRGGGQGRGRGQERDQDQEGPQADEANGTDEPGGPGGAAGPNTPDDSGD